MEYIIPAILLFIVLSFFGIIWTSEAKLHNKIIWTVITLCLLWAVVDQGITTLLFQ